jgi:hypothetical protein
MFEWVGNSFQWANNLAREYQYLISLLGVLAIWATLSYSMSRDRGKFYVFAQAQQTSKVGSAIGAEEIQIYSINVTMTNTTKLSVYVKDSSFHWKLSWRLKCYFLKDYFWIRCIISNSAPDSSSLIEIAPYKSYTILLKTTGLQPGLKELCTGIEKNAYYGKLLPFFIRHFLGLYVTTQSGEVIKAKWDRSTKKDFFKNVIKLMAQNR